MEVSFVNAMHVLGSCEEEKRLKNQVRSSVIQITYARE